jgi:uncharacterized protein YndB with AHSA1/START domain
MQETSDLVSARVFDAPRDAVFEAFRDPKRLAAWWGPRGFTNAFEEFDFRPGGAWRLTMRGPDGVAYAMVKEFLEVVPAERIVLQHHGPMHRFKMTVTLTEQGPKTQVTWRMAFESKEPDDVCAVILASNEQNFDRLAAHLADTRHV